MKQLQIAGSTVTVLTFVLFGCAASEVAPTPSSVDCKSTFERAINWVSVDSLDEEGIRQWVTETYGTEADSSELVDGSTVFRWKAAQKAYSLAFFGRPLRIDVEWLRQSPTIGDMTNCLGAPDSYQASVVPSPVGPSTGLYLWYVNLGVVGWRTESADNKRVSQNTRLEGLYLVRPSAVATMMTKVHPEGSWPSNRLTSSLKAWSGADSVVFSDYTK